ncbi:ABC transporter permease [Amycolatopsis solani]|uniref:ABC transporter permease n=2 Tax=Amycolatopsis solani TaxID=3028615 RepID=UPI00296F23C4|nr:ABC transporter permease [Amycolatopsis sp. MEP2-6]
MSLFALARQNIRARKTTFAAAFVAVFAGSALITASGVLLDSGLRAGIPPQRYAPAAVVVTAPQTESTSDDVDQRFTERVPLAVARAGEIARVPGVAAVVPDVSATVVLRGRGPLVAHGWSSTRLEAVTLTAGRAPERPDEVVLDGARVGDVVDVAVGGVASPYRVVGTVTTGQPTAFLTDEQARVVAGRPDAVDAVAVLAEPGADAAGLAQRIGQAVPGVATATGDDRAGAELLDVGAARSFLTLVAGSFGGTMLVIVLLVVASTLGLANQQRRREFALLRAIAAGPGHIYRLIGIETALVATVAAVLGAIPGVGLSLLLHGVFVRLGSIPAGFSFVLGPVPVLAAVAGSVVAAVAAGLITARRAARISPVDALGEAAVEPPRLGRGRVVTGWVLAIAGTAAGIAFPLMIAGTAGAAGAAGSALLLVTALALLGPRLLTATASVLGKLGLSRPASGFLAGANTRARSRRLGAATTPLIMGVALAAVQIFTLTTTAAAAQRQAEAGLLADQVLVADGGVASTVADAVRRTPGVTAAVSVVHTQVLVTAPMFGEPATEAYAAQGVTAEGLGRVLNLDVRRGDLAGLTGDAVALSESAAGTFGVDLGGTVAMRLGDGTPHTARVVAVYGNGLGYGDLTLPHEAVAGHTTSGLDDEILVAGKVTVAFPEVHVTDRRTFMTARDDAAGAQSAVTLVLNLVLIAFIAIAVVNILVLATAARVREFALLRLVGAKPRQVRAMTRAEAAVVVVAAIVLGSLAALPPLIGVSLSLTGTALPTVPPLIYAGILAAAAVVGWGAIAIPARFALRPAAVTAMRVGE